MNRVNIPMISGENGLSAYMEQIKRYPLLAPEEEFMLAKSFKEHDDQEAAHQLVTSHLRLVAKIAMGYRYYGLPVSDLISEGNIGLMRAVKKFEPDKGFRLATYAMWWIKAAINEYILNSWSLVKVGTVAAQKKLFFNLRKLKARLGAYDDADLTPEQAASIAHTLGVTEKEVMDMNRRMTRADSSLNATVGEDGDMQRQDLLVDDTPNQEDRLESQQERDLGRKLLGQALEELNDRERHIITERRLSENPITLEELGVKYGISRERVRQIESRAFEKIQAAVRKAAAALEYRRGNIGGDILPSNA